MPPAIPGLRCPSCRVSKLTQSDRFAECERCGLVCPVVGGVPIVFEDAYVTTGPAADAAVVRDILEVFRLPSDALAVMRLREVTRRKARFGGTLIQTESAQFLDRVRSSGHGIGDPAQAAGTQDAGARDGAPEPETDAALIPRVAWSRDYVARRMPCGLDLLANVRLENTGGGTLHCSGRHRTVVAVAWRHENGWPADVEDLRTPLPIDLRPGHALTIAIRFRTPARPGIYTMTLTVVQEQLRWLDSDSRTFFVRIEDRPTPPTPTGWQSFETVPVGYDEDHERGLDILSGWLTQPIDRPRRILEIGGNVTPMTTRLDHAIDATLYNVDVDLLGLQVGVLHAAQRGRPVHIVCADASDLPFPDDYFDVIVVFASLHHFPDPGALLSHLGDKLAATGFVALLCEPVGHVWPGAIIPAFLAELEKGVNEQSFSLREYEHMFHRAGFHVAEAINDFNSLKARLVPSGAKG